MGTEPHDFHDANRLRIAVRVCVSMLVGWALFAGFLLYLLASRGAADASGLVLWAVICGMALAVCFPVIVLFSVIALIAAEEIAAHTLLWGAVAGSAGAAFGYSVVKNTGGDEITLAAALLSSLAAAIVFVTWMHHRPVAQSRGPL
jgi:hypothetical protein